MPAHELASRGSKNLCDELYAALTRKIPRLQRSMTKQWCALHEAGGTRFAYIAHRKTTDHIQIWCAGDVDALIRNPYLRVTPRSKFREGWEDKYPARFTLAREDQIDAAADLLFFISYKKSPY